MINYVLLSGGLDSVTLLYYIIKMKREKKVVPIIMTYDSKHNEKETECAKRICEELSLNYIEIDLTDLSRQIWTSSAILRSNEILPYESEHSSLVVPFRNGLFLSVAAAIAANNKEYGKIYIAANFDDAHVFPDCRNVFINSINSAIKLGTGNLVEVRAPFQRIAKAEIVTVGLYLQVPYQLTWSCYTGGERHCGLCKTCIERYGAFKSNKVNDFVEYDNIPTTFPTTMCRSIQHLFDIIDEDDK